VGKRVHGASLADAWDWRVFDDDKAGNDGARNTPYAYVRGATMLLVIAVILLLLFGGLGFVAHVLWLGLILAVIIAVIHMFTRSSA
jgi:hypothetical protein